jgi:hypothetical protein
MKSQGDQKGETPSFVQLRLRPKETSIQPWKLAGRSPAANGFSLMDNAVGKGGGTCTKCADTGRQSMERTNTRCQLEHRVSVCCGQ